MEFIESAVIFAGTCPTRSLSSRRKRRLTGLCRGKNLHAALLALTSAFAGRTNADVGPQSQCEIRSNVTFVVTSVHIPDHETVVFHF